MSHQNWLKGLLRRVIKSTPSTQRKRHPFSPVQFDQLEDRSVPAALDWTGAGANANWSTAANWSQNQVPSATNNVLNFGSAATKYVANNDIPGLTGITISITDASAASDFAITGVNTGVTAVTHNKTDNQASSTTLNLAMTGAGATITDTAGALTILNTDNVFDTASNVYVPTGASLTVSVFPSSSVGNAKFNLTGGALNVAPSGQFFTNAFNVGQNATANNVAPTGTPLASLGTDVQQYPIMADISRSVPGGDTQFQTSTHTWGNNNTYFYSGEIFFPNSNNDGTGSIAFAEQNDDSTFLAIDGVTLLSNTTWNVTNTAMDPNTGAQTITLPTGWHTIDLRFGNGGGGAGPSGQNSQNWVVGNASVTNPTGKGFGYRVTDSAGTEISGFELDARSYRRLYAAPNVYGINAIAESGTTVTVTTAVAGTTTIMNSSVKVGDKVEIAGVTPVAYNGIWTVATVSGNTFTFAHPSSGLAAGTVNANTRLTLPDDGTQRVRYGINAMTASGTTVTVTTAAPGTTTAMPAGVQIGDVVVISGSNVAGFNGTWTVTDTPGANTFTFEATTPGLTGFTASAPNTTVGIPDDKVRIRIPKSVNAVVQNAVSVTGNSTINLDPTLISATMGNLTMASGANLSVVAGNTAGQTLAFGTTSEGGNVTYSPDTGATLNLSGVVSETAAATLTKAGAGTLALGGANTYTGVTTINAGTVIANANGALGAITAGTTVASGGQLVIGGVTYSNAEPVTINGTGTTTTNGALSSGSNATFAGPITLATDSWITSSANTLTLTGGINAGANQLTFAGGGTVTVGTTGITSSGNVVKTQGGTVILNVANPNLTGAISVNAGTLRVSVDGALGTVAGGTTIASGGTLVFVGPSSGSLNYATLEPISVTGVGVNGTTTGAISNLTGDATVLAPITLTGSATIGAQTAGKKLTLSGTLTIPKLSTITFTGAGNVDVTSSFGNGTASTTIPTGTPNTLVQTWFKTPDVARDVNFVNNIGVNNGGILARTPALGSNNLAGSLAYPNLAAFNAVTADPVTGVDAGLNDDFAFLWTGVFTAVKGGKYNFGVGQGTGTDDIVTIFIDLNNDGVFSTAGGELLTTAVYNNTNVSRDLTFTAGEKHRIAIGFHEWGGGEFGSANFRIQGDAAYDTITPIDPTDPGQAGMWAGVSPANLSAGVIANNVIKQGAGTVTLSGTNTYNGTTTINAGILAATSDSALGLTSVPVVVNPGGSFGLAATGGVTIPATRKITISGAGQGNAGAIVNLGGSNTLLATINPLTSDASIGSNAGTLTVSTPINVSAYALTVTGAGDTTMTAPITSALAGGAGLSVGQTNVSNDSSPSSTPNASFGFDIDLTPTMGNKHGNDAALGQSSAKGWATNDTWFYKGQMFWPNSNGNGTGTLSFAENVDDDVYMWIDGVQALGNTAWNVPTTSGPKTLPTGFHNIEIRFSNGGGGAGAVPDGGTGWSTTYGFGYRVDVDPNPGGHDGSQDPAATSLDGNDYSIPTDDGTGKLFRTAVSGNALIKSGSGTLDLTVPNTFVRNISITGGILIPETVATLGTVPTIETTGGSLGLPAAGGFTLPASIALSLKGPGFNNGGGVLNLGGANTVSSPITLASDASIGSNAGTLTVNSASFKVGGFALTVTGAGDTTISSAITSLSVVPGLFVGQTNVSNDSNVASVPNPSFGFDNDLTPTMGNKSGNDATVGQTSAKGWATNDTWFYKGQMFWPNTNNSGSGTLSFAENVDDDVYVWIDGTQKIGNTNWNVATTTGPVTLPTGWHNVEFRFSNGGGGAGANTSQAGWNANKGFGYRVDSDPNDPLASSIDGGDYTIPTDNGTGNLFQNTNIVSGNALVKTGTGTLNLTGANTITRTIAINGGLLAPSNVAALGGTPTISTDGGSLGLPAAGGFTLPASIAVKLGGAGSNGAGAILNLGGSNTVLSPITLAKDGSIGANAGTLTVSGASVNTTSYTLTVTGAGDTVISAPISGDAKVPAAAGLNVGQTNVNNDSNVASVPNAAYGSDIDLGFSIAQKSQNDAPVTATNLKTWATNDTWFYKGQMFWPNSNGNGTGTLSFAENVDDSVFMWVDGVQKMNNTSWNTPSSSGAITLPTGWHDIEVRFSNGGGGAGANVVNSWTTTKGFGYRIDKDPVANGPNGAADPLASSIQGNDYTIVVDDGTGTTFRTAFVANDEALVKTGTGTLMLSGNNTYTRGSSFKLVTGAANNQVKVTGPVALAAGSQLQIASGFTSTSPFVLISNDGTDVVTGTFNGLAEGATVTAGANNFTISYKGGDGNDVVLTPSGTSGTAPTISSITFNGGLTGFNATEHSRMINATVAFDQPVNLDTDAMTLALHTNNVNYAGNLPNGTGQPTGAAVPATLIATPSTDKMTWTLTWSGNNTQVGSTDQLASLLDGVYDLVINASKVHLVSSPGVTLAANSTTVFHRLFGDTNPPAASGNDFTAVLAGNDNLAFRSAFNKPIGGGYVSYLDFNGDGNINSADNLAFRTRFNKNLTWTV